MPVVRFWLTHREELATLLAEHVLLVAIATMAAVAIGVPLGVFAARRPRLASPLVGIANVVQTIPSLAMFGFLLPVPLIGGVGARAALVVLVLYALLPIVRSTIVGLSGIDRSVREAGLAMGMTERELLRQVELPLALPSIIAGIRVAAVVGVGSATIAAAIGAGGLGQYIYRGLSMVDSTVILAGAIPAALLALIVDGGLLWLERQLSPRRRASSRTGACGSGNVGGPGAGRRRGHGGARRRGDRGGVEELHRAVDSRGDRRADDRARDGTLRPAPPEPGRDVDRRSGAPGRRRRRLRGIHRHGADRDLPPAAIDRSAGRHRDRPRSLCGQWTDSPQPPLGFDNTFAILVRGADAREHGLRTIEDAARVAPRWRAAFGYEFLERPDGYPGLSKTYGLAFRGPPQVMDLTLSYRALASGQVDLIAGDATAGLINSLDLFQLDDNRHYFPPYDAVPVARAATLHRYPQVREALEGLAGRISAADMREMNHAADAERENPADIARRFLERAR